MVIRLSACSNCKYYTKFEGVCCNADSEHCADFVDSDSTCSQHELTDNLAKFTSMVKAMGFKEASNE